MLRVGCAVAVVVYVAVRSGCLSFYLFAIAFTLDSVVRVFIVVVSVVTIAALKNSFNIDIEHIEFFVWAQTKNETKNRNQNELKMCAILSLYLIWSLNFRWF